MSTYAKHQIWVGVATHDLSREFIEKLETHIGRHKGLEDAEKNSGLPLQAISMHGETIGYGTMVHQLDWITTEEKPEIFESHKYSLAIEAAQAHLQYIFEKLELPIRVHCYHHIDLGG